ncbi:MAG: hypothetical protein MI867_19745 [Pseudomonadales bacterium]|nr:hypothetical protein [Pseudomonadales bacterium]
MTLAERIEADLKAEIAEAGRTITDPRALVAWMSDHGVGRSTMSAATGADWRAVRDKERAAVRDVPREEYERLSLPLTPENYPGDAASWTEYRPFDLLMERLGAALEEMAGQVEEEPDGLLDLTDDEVVAVFYHWGLQREPDEAGFQFWVERFAQIRASEPDRILALRQLMLEFTQGDGYDEEEAVAG